MSRPVWPSRKIKGMKCHYCQVFLEKSPSKRYSPDYFTWQHIIPRRLGGKSEPENLRPCCYGCNQLLSLVGDCPASFACLLAINASISDFKEFAFKIGTLEAPNPNSKKRKRKAYLIALTSECLNYIHQNNLAGPFGCSLGKSACGCRRQAYAQVEKEFENVL